MWQLGKFEIEACCADSRNRRLQLQPRRADVPSCAGLVDCHHWNRLAICGNSECVVFARNCTTHFQRTAIPPREDADCSYAETRKLCSAPTSLCFSRRFRAVERLCPSTRSRHGRAPFLKAGYSRARLDCFWPRCDRSQLGGAAPLPALANFSRLGPKVLLAVEGQGPRDTMVSSIANARRLEAPCAPGQFVTWKSWRCRAPSRRAHCKSAEKASLRS
jgi:hypothetical protein